MDLNEYQRKALRTSRAAQRKDPQSSHAALLGLASEVGSILDVFKRYVRDNSMEHLEREIIAAELGDTLWYIAAIASTLDLQLDKIATSNLERAREIEANSVYVEKLGIHFYASPMDEEDAFFYGSTTPIVISSTTVQSTVTAVSAVEAGRPGETDAGA